MSTSYGTGADQPGRAPAEERGDVLHDTAPDRRSVVNTQKELYGGVKVGSAFFGWLTATGTAVLLTALLAAAGTAVGVATNTDVQKATSQATSQPGTVGLVGAIVLLV